MNLPASPVVSRPALRTPRLARTLGDADRVRAAGKSSTDRVDLAASSRQGAPVLSSVEGHTKPSRLATSSDIDILLVEDDEDLREAMADTLTDAGYNVAAVGHGRDALEWLEDNAVAPKLILLDLMMPVMDGWQFLEQRRSAPRVAAVPVVVLSASEVFTDESNTLPFMRKPIALKPLLALVASYCGARSGSE